MSHCYKHGKHSTYVAYCDAQSTACTCDTVDPSEGLGPLATTIGAKIAKILSPHEGLGYLVVVARSAGAAGFETNIADGPLLAILEATQQELRKRAGVGQQ